MASMFDLPFAALTPEAFLGFPRYGHPTSCARAYSGMGCPRSCRTPLPDKLFRCMRVTKGQNGSIVSLGVPRGTTKNDIKIQLEDHTLTLNIDYRYAHPVSRGANITHRSTFSRSFDLGDDIDVDGITAHLENNTLTVTLPYREPPAQPQPRQIVIEGPEANPEAETQEPKNEDEPGTSISHQAAAEEVKSLSGSEGPNSLVQSTPDQLENDKAQEGWVDVGKKELTDAEPTAEAPTLNDAISNAEGSADHGEEEEEEEDREGAFEEVKLAQRLAQLEQELGTLRKVLADGKRVGKGKKQALPDPKPDMQKANRKLYNDEEDGSVEDCEL